MENFTNITDGESLYLSLSPFTLIELFSSDINMTILPYLTENRKMTVPKDHVFYNTGETTEKVFFLKKGIIEETIMNENGLEKSFIIAPPYPIGLHYCAHQQPIFPCTKAYTECEIYQFKYDELLNLIQQDKSLLKSILKTSSLDFRLANSSSMQNYSLSSYEKVCQTILSYFVAAKYNPYIKGLKMSQELIAKLTGVHRTSAVRAIQKLKQENIILYEKKKLICVDYEKLKDLAFGKYPIK